MITRHTIEHTLNFRYSAPVHASVMTLYLCPLQDRNQVLPEFAIESDPRRAGLRLPRPVQQRGHFLNRPGPHERLVVRTRCTVEVGPARGLPDRLEPSEWAGLRGSIRDPEAVADAASQPLRSPLPCPALERFMRTHGLASGDDPLATALELRETLHRTFEYAPGSTAADSPIERILESGRGVCQDYAHVMTSTLRTWGIPCRYVSGYLGPDPAHSPPGESHAWVECWFPDLGWVGLDPTNNSAGDERHVRVAVGRDYADVPPTRGVYRGWAESVLTPAVTVTREDL